MAAPRTPLDGITVVDLTTVIMGPFATHILADLGAEVIKVESPEGDSLRGYAPQRHSSMSGSFLNLNRNKRSVCLDLKRPAGRAALDRLVERADVFVHNLRPGPIDRLGYGYERVRELNPQIIYCAGCGFGPAGPYAEKPAYDDIIQAGSGLAALQAAAQGQPGYAPTVICDKLAGQAIAYAILAALFHRERGGGGQAIDVPMFETAIEFNLMEHMGGFAFEPPLGPPGFARVLSPERKPYRTLDGYICILPYSDRNWRDFYAFTGRREFESDRRFATLPMRVQHIEHLYRMVAEEAAKRTTAAWLAFCDEVGIPSMPVRSLQELPDDPHVQAVGLFSIADHPTEGPYRVIRRPVSFSKGPFEISRHAPNLGEHTAEVLAEAGLSHAQIQAALAEADVAGPME
jgi:crotonobetainyl-CoA:carnitine CoA-transferase CaiB-like acyl-CoA transferase